MVPEIIGNQPIGNISAGDRIGFTPTGPEGEVGFRGSTFGNISAETILGRTGNVEFLATKSIGNVTVINGDYNNMSDLDGDGDVNTPPATPSELSPDHDPLGAMAPVLTDVIFQAMDDIGDIWLQQDTDSQAIARAEMPSTEDDQGVGFAAGGSIGDVHIQGSRGFMDTDKVVTTLMAPDSMGGLFILAGDSDAAGVGGMASDDAVTIGTVTIELDLSSDTDIFGAPNSAGGGFVIASGGQPVAPGIYATGAPGNTPANRIDVSAGVVERTAHGSIGDIVLNDIAMSATSSLAENPNNFVEVIGTAVMASSIIIADELGTVTHQTNSYNQTVLELSASPFTTVFYRSGGVGANVDGADGNLLIAVF